MHNVPGNVVTKTPPTDGGWGQKLKLIDENFEVITLMIVLWIFHKQILFEFEHEYEIHRMLDQFDGVED